MAGAVNGLAVGLATGGGLLLYAGIRNVTIGDTIRDVLSIPNGGTPISKPFGQVTSGLAPYVGGTVGGGNASSTAAGAASGSTLVAQVRSQIGKPYGFNTAGPDRFDCSGLVVWGLRRSGFPTAPRFSTVTFGTWAKANGFTKITDSSQFAAGDVVVKAGHMGVLSGPGTMIDAPHAGAVVREEALWSPLGQWWAWRIGTGVFTAPVGQRVGVKASTAQEQAELRRLG